MAGHPVSCRLAMVEGILLDSVYMKENDLNPDKYYKPDGKSSRSKSGSGSGSGTEGCYLTSACVTARGLSDQCEELQALRSFRDGYLSEQPGGPAEIEQYLCNGSENRGSYQPAA